MFIFFYFTHVFRFAGERWSSPFHKRRLRKCTIFGTHLRGSVSHRAFTIIELMVVVVILGLLATAVVVNVTGYISQGRIERTKMDIATLKNAVELFYLQRHRYPTNEEGLEILTRRTATHPSGIISELPADSWGRSYVYVCPGEHGAFDIMSLGRDGTRGGEGEDEDIVSWDLNENSDNALP